MSNYRDSNLHFLRAVSKACILVLVAWIGLLIVLTSINYFPPDFGFGFLKGRESYFFSWYAVAFYTHVISASAGLFIGLIQSLGWVRRRYIRLHQRFGMVYAYVVLLLVGPSGLAMSLRAGGSGIAIAGFALLSVATILSTWLGVYHIRRGNLALHRMWMTRSYLLMCSAVTLRFIAAITDEFGLNLSYDAMAWLSWVPQLVLYEVIRKNPRRRSQS